MPEIYIVARCGSNDEQLAYVDTRVEDLMDLKNPLNLGELNPKYKGIMLRDKMRFFHGDGPSATLEMGNNKTGYYNCPTCLTHTCMYDDIALVYQASITSIQDRREFVKKGPIGYSNSMNKKASPFENLTALEMKRELVSRGVDLKGLKITKTELQPVLNKTLKGVKRLPILLLDNPGSDLSELGLEDYEISFCEPMHDLAAH